MHMTHHRCLERRPWCRSFVGTGLVLTLALAGACRSSGPKELVVPDVRTELLPFVGDPLAGFESTPLESERAEDAYLVTVELGFLEQGPARTLPLLSSRSRLVVAMTGEAPIRPVPDLGVWSMLASDDSASAFLSDLEQGSLGRYEHVDLLIGALPARGTLAFRATAPDGATGPSSDNRLTLHLHRRADDALTVVLDSEVSTASASARAARAGRAAPDDGQSANVHELIVLEDAPGVDADPFLFVMQSPLERDGAFVLRIDVEGAPNDPAALAEHAQRLAAYREPRTSSDLPGELRRALAQQEASPPSGDSSQASAPTPSTADAARRSALAIVAAASAAPVCRDFVLTAPADLLETYLQRLGEPEPAGQDGSWRLEREAYHLLAQQAVEPDVQPELEALLLVHAGEIGRHPEEVERLLGASEDRETFRAFLVAENRGYLQSPNPTSRARSCAWLQARGIGPDAFDPLASVEDRREVLRAYARSLEQTASDDSREAGR